MNALLAEHQVAAVVAVAPPRKPTMMNHWNLAPLFRPDPVLGRLDYRGLRCVALAETLYDGLVMNA